MLWEELDTLMILLLRKSKFVAVWIFHYYVKNNCLLCLLDFLLFVAPSEVSIEKRDNDNVINVIFNEETEFGIEKENNSWKCVFSRWNIF